MNARLLAYDHAPTLMLVLIIALHTATVAGADDKNAGGSAAADAEFAVRWNPAKGGPSSAEDAVKALGLKPEDTDVYAIRYFTAGKPDEAPRGFRTILRERVKKKKAELTYKIRGDKPLPANAPLSAWQCPLGGDKKKEEVDVSILDGGKVKRVYSRSCEIEGAAGELHFPERLRATAVSCASTMVRIEAGGYKVEEWQLGSAGTLIEVSLNGKDTRAELDAFSKKVVGPLLKAGAKPADRSKSDAGSDCKPAAKGGK